MMFFVKSLTTYAAKNRACLKLNTWLTQFDHVIIKDDVALDALKATIEAKVNEINTEHPKLKQIGFRYNKSLLRISSQIMSAGCPDEIFILDICKVKGFYQFSETLSPEAVVKLELMKGGQL